MKKFALILLFVAGNIALAQSSNDSINQTDIEGKRQGRWIVTNKLMKPPLPEYKDDQKVEEGRYSDGKKIGIWTAWYPNGVMKNRITFDNGRPFGKAIMYHENGKVSEEGLWQNNRWIGDYKMYYDNGNVQHQFNFNKTGKREGEQTYFAENGQEIIKGDMKDGKEVGVWVEHYDNGDMRSKKAFNDGNLDPANTTEYAPVKPDVKPVENTTTNTVTKTKDIPKNDKVDLKTEEINGGGSSTSKEPAKAFIGEGEAKLYGKNKLILEDGNFHLFKLVNGKKYMYSKDGILERIAVFHDGKYIGDAPLPTE